MSGKKGIVLRTGNRTGKSHRGRLVVTPDGIVLSDWLTPIVDKILSKLGVPKSDFNRFPWCG